MADLEIMVVEDDAIEIRDIKRTIEFFSYLVHYLVSKWEDAVNKTLNLISDIILKGKTSDIKLVSKIKNLNMIFTYLTVHSEKSQSKKPI